MQELLKVSKDSNSSYLATVFPADYNETTNKEAISKTSVDIEVVNSGGSFDLRKFNLEKTDLFQFLPSNLKTAADLDELESWFLDQFKDDGTEISSWMSRCAAMNAFLDARCKEYNRCSFVKARAGDGNVPGVSLDGAWFTSVNGLQFKRHGTTCHHPGGKTKMYPDQNASFIYKDWLGFASTGKPWDYYVQYQAMLGHFVRLAEKISKDVMVFKGWAGNLPMFLAQVPPKNVERVKIHYTIFSDRDSHVIFTLRDPSDYTNVVDISDKVLLGQGQNDIYIYMASYPQVPCLVHHLDFGEGKLVIRKYEVKKTG